MRGDDDIVAAGDGGFTVDTRFESNWLPVAPPENANDLPSAEDAARALGYLRRMVARGWPVWRVFAFRVVRGAESTEGGTRLLYVYKNVDRDADEAVVIKSPEQFTRWVRASLRIAPE